MCAVKERLLSLGELQYPHWEFVVRHSSGWIERPVGQWPRLDDSRLSASLIGTSHGLMGIADLINNLFLKVLSNLHIRRDATVIEIATDVDVLSAAFAGYLNRHGRYHLLHEDPRAVEWVETELRIQHANVSASVLDTRSKLPSGLAPDVVIDRRGFVIGKADLVGENVTYPVAAAQRLTTQALSQGARALIAAHLIECLPAPASLSISWDRKPIGCVSQEVRMGYTAENDAFDAIIFEHYDLVEVLRAENFQVDRVLSPVNILDWQLTPTSRVGWMLLSGSPKVQGSSFD